MTIQTFRQPGDQPRDGAEKAQFTLCRVAEESSAECFYAGPSVGWGWYAYVSGAMPIALFHDLGGGGKHAHLVFICILRKARIKQTTIIPFAAADVPVPLDERARRRAIRNLAAAGFVHVEQHEGRPPLVDIGHEER